MTVNDHPILAWAGLSVVGAWRGTITGAFLYGLLLVVLDLLYSRLRVERARVMTASKIRAYVLRSFLTRLSLYLVGIALAIRIFDRTGVVIVGAMLLFAIPAGIIMAAKLGKSSGG